MPALSTLTWDRIRSINWPTNCWSTARRLFTSSEKPAAIPDRLLGVSPHSKSIIMIEAATLLQACIPEGFS